MTSTSTPGATSATSAAARWVSAHRSALVSTTTGVAPLSQARASIRSIRPCLSGSASETATATVSTFAASTWAWEVREEVARTTAVRRSSTSTTVAEAAV